jgi:hypothetical protein
MGSYLMGSWLMGSLLMGSFVNGTIRLMGSFGLWDPGYFYHDKWDHGLWDPGIIVKGILV